MREYNKKTFSRGETLLWMVITAATVFVATSFQYTRMTLGSEDYNTPSNISGDHFKKLERVLDVIDKNFLFEYDVKELEEGAIRGLVEALGDPYTDYFNVSESEEFLQETEGEYEGVGIYMALDTSKDMVIVLMPIKGSPAEEAGVLPGDYIVKVDDKDVKGVSTEEIASLIKGKKETTVKVTFRRYNEDGTYEEFEKELTRRKVDLNPFSSEIIEENIGYIAFTSFDEKAYNDFKNAIKNMKNETELKGLIIDLRDNPGGLLTTATKIIDEILPTGVITYTVDKNGNKEHIYSDSRTLDIPVVVIINENSASASEIMAAAIKDYSKGAVVGTTSFGKGLVQQLKSLRDGTYLKVTISEYFSPSGNKINEVGVEPDYIVEIPEDGELTEDIQLKKSIEIMKDMIK